MINTANLEYRIDQLERVLQELATKVEGNKELTNVIEKGIIIQRK